MDHSKYLWTDDELDRYGKDIISIFSLPTFESSPSNTLYVNTQYGRKTKIGLAKLLIELSTNMYKKQAI